MLYQQKTQKNAYMAAPKFLNNKAFKNELRKIQKDDSELMKLMAGR